MFTENRTHAFLGREPGPEARLLLYCARTEVPPDMAERIRALSRAPLDWEVLADSAEKHRVTQLLFRNLSALCPEALPAPVRTRLRHQFFTNAGFSLKLANALVSLLQAFAAAGIPVLPFKGSVLAHCTYGKLALRQNYDIDLLIAERDLPASRQTLQDAGFVCDEVFDRELRYHRIDDGVEVDLHWAFAPRYFHHSVDFDELLRRSRDEMLLGQRVSTLSAEDFLLVLCLQVVKDSWERRQQLEHLSKVCDIAEHLRAHPRLDWAWIRRAARQDGLQRVVHCALTLACELLGAELPPEVARAVAADARARDCARRMCGSLFTGGDTLSPLANPYLSLGLRWQQLRFYLAVRERYRERFRHLAEIIRPVAGEQPVGAADNENRHLQ